MQKGSGLAYNSSAASDADASKITLSDAVHMRLMGRAQELQNLLVELNPDRLTINDFDILDEQLSNIRADLAEFKALQAT